MTASAPAAGDGWQQTADFPPAGTALPAAASVANPAERPGPPGGGFPVSIAHAIAAGGLALAILAGVGVTAIDYPWPLLADVLSGRGKTGVPTVPVRPVEPAGAMPSADAARPPPAAPVAEARPPARTVVAKDKTRPTSTATPIKRVGKTKPVLLTAAKPSIDDAYQRQVERQCSPAIGGLLCRERVRWRLCNGRWNDGQQPGETRCQVGRSDAPDRLGGA